MNIALLSSNALIICISILVYTGLAIALQNKILVNVLNINKDDIKRTWMVQTVLVSFIRMATPMPYSIILEVAVQMIIYKLVLNLKFEKLIILEEINLVISSSANLICAKINQTNLFSQVSNNIFMFTLAGILAILIYAFVYFLINKFKIKLNVSENLNQKAKNQIVEVSVVSSVLILINEISLFNMFEILPTSIYILAIVLVVCYYLITVISINKTIQIQEKQSKISNLEGNNTRLQESFDDVRSFRHDMKNIMQGMGGYIAAKDIDGLTNMYNEFICDCKGIKNAESFESLANSSPAIYNLINNKYIEAKKYGITINVEVYVNLNSLKIKIYELCRVLGILIDNAIEASKECDNKQICIKFIKDSYNNRNLVIIENPCKNTLLDLSKLKQKGFTTKKDKRSHGLGLWRVNKIVQKNENLRLTTSRGDGNIFKQQLEIYNWK